MPNGSDWPLCRLARTILYATGSCKTLHIKKIKARIPPRQGEKHVNRFQQGAYRSRHKTGICLPSAKNGGI